MNRIVRTIVSIEEAFISILLPIMCIVVLQAQLVVIPSFYNAMG